MDRKKVLFLLGDIWSLGKNKGMPSIYKVLEVSHEKFEIYVFTTDENRYDKELPNAHFFYFNNFKNNFKNRYISYFLSRINNIFLNIKYIIQFFSIKAKIDLIYCSSSIPIFATIFFKNVYSIKTIHRIYGTFLFPKLGNKLDQIKKFEEVLIFKSQADRYIITNDGTYGDKVAQYYGVEESKILFLRNGIDKFDIPSNKDEIYSKFELNSKDFHIISVSRLVSWKRVDRTIKAMNSIDNKQIKLLVVGDGEEGKILKSICVNENIKFMGSVSSKDVKELMSIADIFVSMYDLSNVGNPLLEALHVGLPIVTYDSGDTRNIINGSNGILISKSNENDIIDKIKYYILLLFKDRTLRCKLSLEAKKYAENNLLSWNERIEIEVKAMEEVINE